MPQAPRPLPSAAGRSSFTPATAYGSAHTSHHASDGRQRRRTARRGGRILAGTGTIAALVAVSLSPAGIFDRDRIATALGFGIEQVSLTGHRFTADADLFAALDLKSARSLVSFDADATGKRLQRLPWVQSVEITRVWPGQLAIRVKERKAFAVWERGEVTDLVDATGRVLGPVKRDAPLDLPHIAGEGANAGAAPLLTTLGRHPEIAARVQRAVRVGDRRWTLELKGGGRIHLPSDGEASALARLAAEPPLLALLDAPGRVIDLRSPSRVAVRQLDGGAAAAASGGGM